MLLGLACPVLAQGAEAFLATASEAGRGRLVSVDPESGALTTLAEREDADFLGFDQEKSGDLVVAARGRIPQTGSVLRYSRVEREFQRLAAGGFLIDPVAVAVAPSGWIYVIDRSAVGGDGALLRIHPETGEQELMAFGPALSRPRDLAFGPRGELYVLGTSLLRVDPLLGTVIERIELPLPLRSPSGLAVDGTGRVLISDRGVPGAALGLLLRHDPALGTTRVLAAGLDQFADIQPFDADRVAYAQTGPGPAFLGTVGSDGVRRLLAAGLPLSGLGAFGPVSLQIPGVASDFRSEPLPGRFEAPARPELPPVSIEVHPDHVLLLHGPGPEDDERLDGGSFPLVTALRAAQPGSDPVLGIYGDIPGSQVTIGAGDSDQKAYVAHWGPVPMRFALVGMTPDARLREFAVWQRMNDGTVNGGVADMLVQNLTLEARYSAAFATPKTHNMGLLRFYECHFAAGRENLAVGAYSGFGYKWGIRSHGRARFDLRNCTFEPVLEHCVYVDSPQGDSIFQGLRHRGSTRTAVQVVNRSLDNPGLSGFGTLLFDDIHIFDLWGDGGSGITVSGHLGDLIFRNIRARESAASGGSHGGIVVWTDDGPDKGVFLYRGEDGGLYSSRSVTIESCDLFLPNADRPQIAIAGCEQVDIEAFYIRGDRAAFSFDSSFGTALIDGPAVVDGQGVTLSQEWVRNGRVRFAIPCPLSAFIGFGSAVKILEEDRVLTNQEIDAEYCP